MFFHYLSQLIPQGVDLNMTVSRNEAGMTVMLMPRVNGLQDPAQNKLIPLTLKGDPKELDANFFPSISAPVRKTAGLLLNMSAFEKQAQEAAAASKAEKDKKDAASKEAKEKKEKYDGFMKKAEEAEKAGKTDEAILQYRQARLHAGDKNKKTIDDKLGTLRTGSLFDVPAAVPAQPVQPAAPEAQPIQPAEVQRQQIASPAPNLQPNIQDFGIFAQPAAQAPPAAQPVQNAAPVSEPAMTAPAPVAAADVIVPGENVCRDNEYDDYPDFPMEMRPPVFAGNTAGY